MAVSSNTTYDIDVAAGTTAGATGSGLEILAKAFMRISPEMTPFYSSAPTTKAHTAFHEWMRDDLDTAATNAAIEGADHSNTTATALTRYRNYTQIMRKDVQVTRTQQSSFMAGNIGKLMAFEKAKAMKSLKRDCETSYFQSTSGSGAAATARTMVGIISALSAVGGNASTATADRALDTTLFNAVASSAYDDGAEVDKLYVSPAVKILLSQLVATAYGTRFLDSKDGVIDQRVEVYNGDLGVYRVVTDRYTTTDTICFIDSEHWKRAVLDSIMIKDIPPGGDSLRAIILCEETLQFHPDAGGLLEDIC